MQARIFKLDSFTTRRFSGNPAAVVLLDSFPDATTMQLIAAENNLAETAFLVPEGSEYRLRWFTPTVEVPLCGHATLASAAVLMERVDTTRTSVIFHSASGSLPVSRTKTGYLMNFPARPSEPVDAWINIDKALGIAPVEVYVNPFSYMAILENEAQVRSVKPEMTLVSQLDRSAIIVTARGNGHYDFVSRNFAPAKGIPEDPVTGAAHCTLAPYWAKRLGKTEFQAFQASSRGGEIICRLREDRVELEGACVFYLEGEIQF